MSNQDFINSIKDYAIAIYNEGGNLLPSVTIAQAILESGWGKSKLSIECKNLFGIKGDYNGSYGTYPTQEYINGKWITVNANFRKYPTYKESLKDHDNLMNLDRYSFVRQSKTYQTQCNNLYMCGYATDPSYADKLIEIIEYNKLYDFDTVKVEASKTINGIVEYDDRADFVVVTDVLNVRQQPTTSSTKVAQYFRGEKLYSYGYCINDGYVWRIYTSYNGEKRFIAERTIDKSEIYLKVY